MSRHSQARCYSTHGGPLSDAPAPAAAPESTPDPNSPPPSEATADDGRTFSQADVDRIVTDRLAKQGRKFADYDDLAKKAAKLDELEAASQSDLEKAQARADQAEAAAANAVKQAQAQLSRAAVLVEAAKAGAVDPDAVWALLPSDAVTLDDAGDVQGAADAVKTLLDAKPYLAQQQQPPAPSAGNPANPAKPSPQGQALTREDLARMTPDQIMQAEKNGQLDHILGRA